MVIYNLVCKKKHSFEGWFPSYEDFKKQAEKKLISCPTCGSTKVEKVPHACAVHVTKEEAAPPTKQARSGPTDAPSPAEVKEMLLRVHHYIKENFEDVGPRFADEARRIHRGDSDERRIHGTATRREREELTEEGVPFIAIPKPELDG